MSTKWWRFCLFLNVLTTYNYAINNDQFNFSLCEHRLKRSLICVCHATQLAWSPAVTPNWIIWLLIKMTCAWPMDRALLFNGRGFIRVYLSRSSFLSDSYGVAIMIRLTDIPCFLVEHETCICFNWLFQYHASCWINSINICIYILEEEGELSCVIDHWWIPFQKKDSWHNQTCTCVSNIYLGDINDITSNLGPYD